MRARSIVEEKTAPQIGAQAKGGFCSFDDNFRGGTRDGCKQPIQAVIARDILDAPGLILLQQFVVAFGDAEDGVHRFDPFPGDSLSSDHGGEHAMKRFTEAVCFFEKGIRGLRVTLGQKEESGATLGRDNSRCLEEGDEFFPEKLG